jgi:aldehyde:ferredoxin oxidoreductase
MGVKRIKAVAVRGTKQIATRWPKKFDKAVKEAEDKIRSYPGWKFREKSGSMGITFSKNAEIAAKYLIRGPKGCYCPCMMGTLYGCDLITNVDAGKYAGTRMLIGGITQHGADADAFGISIPAAWKYKELSNRYGMDSEGPLYFALELYQRGIITKEDTDGFELTRGNDEVLMEMLGRIAYRKGFGDILAEGTTRAAKKIGKDSERYDIAIKGLETLVPMIWNIKVNGPEPMSHDPRWWPGDKMQHHISILTGIRGGDNLKGTHATIEEGFPEWARRLNWGEREYLRWLVDSLDIFDDIKDKIFGIPPRINSLNEPMITKWHTDLASLYDSLGFCLFSSSHLGPTYYAKLYSSGTGLDISPRRLMKTGERVFNIVKAYMVREGFRREHDNWPNVFYEEPALAGPAKGIKLDKQKIDRAIDEYYELRGWAKKTGIPKRDKLVELRLDDVADDLQKLER